MSNSIRFQGRIPQWFANQPATKRDIPEMPILKPLSDTGSSPLNQQQALSFKAVTFAGNRFQVAEHVRLESKFLDEIQTETNPDFKAAMAEMLGRVQSIRAIAVLSNLLQEKEAIAVRIASIRALGSIGESTHPDSFTRTQLGETLIATYEARKKALANSARPARLDLSKQVSAAEEHKLKLEELRAISETLGLLNIEAGKQLLQDEFTGAFDISENHTYRAQEMLRAIQMAEEFFVQHLETQFKKPFAEIVSAVPPQQLAKMRNQLTIEMADGSKFSLAEAKATIQTMQKQQKIANDILAGLVNGLAQMNDKQVNASLKLALDSSNPSIRAKAIGVLGQRNMLSYTADIYPNLRHKNGEIRLAALNALLASNENAAIQKLMEFLMPMDFLKVLGPDTLSKNPEAAIQAFDTLILHLAQNGDKYVHSLKKVALDKDFDLQARQIALATLQTMTQPPISQELSKDTIQEARKTIRDMATDPSGNTPEEKRVISYVATSLWVSLKEHAAVRRALSMLGDPIMRLNSEEQLNLLGSIFSALQQDYDAVHQTQRQQSERGHLILNILQREESAINQDFSKIKSSLQPSIQQILTSPQTLDESFKATSDLPVDTDFVQKVRGDLKYISPLISQLLDHPNSTETRMLASRLAGVLGDTNNLDRLMTRLKDPLGGMVDWTQTRSYKGDPAQDGANIRLNAMVSLGQMGDPKALDLMASALDDTTLRRYAVAPLKQLAKRANTESTDEQLQNVREKLGRLLANPDTTRLSRSIRMSAADTLFAYKGGVDEIKAFIKNTPDLNFKRHVISALIANDYAVDPQHADHALVKGLLYPGLGVEKLHSKVSGKGIEGAIVDGGYVDKNQTEGFQNRVKLPPSAKSPEHTHPTMVMTTMAGNGKLKGVAPDMVIYSDKWPELGGPNPMDVYKKLIEGKLRGENNIRVINNSWGFSNNGVVIFKDVRNILKEFKNVCELAEKAGIQIVFSAGNEGEGIGIPGIGTLGLFGVDVDKLTSSDKATLDYILDKIVLVGASNTQGMDNDHSKHRLAEFSSIGDSLNNKLIPTVVAPGVDMMVYSWNKGKQGKELVNGTSFSGPYVAGLIGLLCQANPNITPAQIREVLISTAVKLPGLSDTQQGHGQVDPAAAVAKAISLGKRQRKTKPASPEKPTEPTTPPPSSNVVALPKPVAPEAPPAAEAPVTKPEPEQPDQEKSA